VSFLCTRPALAHDARVASDLATLKNLYFDAAFNVQLSSALLFVMRFVIHALSLGVLSDTVGWVTGKMSCSKS